MFAIDWQLGLERLWRERPLPKIGFGKFVYLPDFETRKILKGTIEIFDCYRECYLVNFGNGKNDSDCSDSDCSDWRWCTENEIFITRKAAKEVMGGVKCQS